MATAERSDLREAPQQLSEGDVDVFFFFFLSLTVSSQSASEPTSAQSQGEESRSGSGRSRCQSLHYFSKTPRKAYKMSPNGTSDSLWCSQSVSPPTPHPPATRHHPRSDADVTAVSVEVQQQETAAWTPVICVRVLYLGS